MTRSDTAVTVICLVELQQCKPAFSAQESPMPLVSFHNIPFLSVCTTRPVTFLLTDFSNLGPAVSVGQLPTTIGRGGLCYCNTPPPHQAAGRFNFEEGATEWTIVVKLVHTSISVCNLQSNCVCATTIEVPAPIQTAV